MVRFAILLGLALLSAPSWAIEDAQISAQPLVYVKDGKPEGCGIRLVGVALSANLRTARGFDVSANLWATGRATAKGLSYDVDDGKQPREVALHSFWIKAPNGSTGEAYETSTRSAIDVFDAVLDSAQLRVGIRRASEPEERVYSGIVQITAGERAQIWQCLKRMTE